MDGEGDEQGETCKDTQNGVTEQKSDDLLGRAKRGGHATGLYIRARDHRKRNRRPGKKKPLRKVSRPAAAGACACGLHSLLGKDDGRRITGGDSRDSTSWL